VGEIGKNQKNKTLSKQGECGRIFSVEDNVASGSLRDKQSPSAHDTSAVCVDCGAVASGAAGRERLADPL